MYDNFEHVTYLCPSLSLTTYNLSTEVAAEDAAAAENTGLKDTED